MKKLIAVILGVVDLGLLVMIIISAASGWRIHPSRNDQLVADSPPPPTAFSLPESPSVPESTLPPENTSTDSSEITSPQASAASEPEASTVSKPEASTVSKPEASTVSKPEASTVSKPEASTVSKPEASTVSKPEASTVSKPEASTVSKPEASTVSRQVPHPDTIQTSGYPTLSDVTGFEYKKGWTNRSDSAVKLTKLSEVRGGWKAYMVCDPENKRNSSTDKMLNLRIEAGQTGVVVTADWYYTFFNETGTGVDDTTPDSTFTGKWSDGQLTAVGSGKITLHDFYAENGRETAMGEMILPDGVEAVIALVRP